MSLTKKGRTTLSIVAELGNDAMLWTLIEDDSSKVNLADIDGRTPLSYAAGNGHTLTVDHLLENGGFADVADINKRTPLSWAAASGHISTSQLLLDNNANPNSRDVDGKTPLIYACANGHKELVAQLLNWDGTSPVLKDYNFSPPLLYAAIYGHNDIIETLLTRQEVVNDWALQGWKEENLKDALKESNPGEWNDSVDISWDLEMSRMPQAHAMLRGHVHTAALLSFHWTRLGLAPRPVRSGAGKREDYEAPRGRTRYRTAIGLRGPGTWSGQSPA